MTGSDQVLTRWRKNLLKGIKRDIREELGPRPPAIQSYYRAYREVFRRSAYSVTTQESVMAALPGHHVIYLGDFHTLRKSQQSHKTVIQQLLREGTRPTILMEMFASSDQKHLDAFMTGKIDLDAFLEQIKYKQSWGFCWNNYAPLLSLARKNRLPVFGINLKRNTSLKERDLHFAREIGKQITTDPQSPLVVIVGDLHCAPSHLPARVEDLLGRDHRTMIIYQNSETIYLKEMEEGKAERLEAVDLGNDRYCIFNTPPWIKMETYLLWLQNSEELLGRQLGFSGKKRDYLEYDSQMALLSTQLSGLLEIAPLLPEEITFAAMDDYDFLVQLLNIPHAHPFFHLLQDHQAFYVPGEEIIYIPHLDLNRAAAQTAHAILSRHHGFSKTHVYQSGFFLRRVLYLAAGHVATRLVNPSFSLKRRDLTRETLSRSGDRHSQRKLSHLRRGHRLASLFWDYITQPHAQRPPYDSAEANRRDAEASYRAGHHLSHWVAGVIVDKIESGAMTPADIVRLFPAPGERERDALERLRGIIGS